MTPTPDNEKIVARFFVALNELIDKKRLDSFYMFANRYEIDRRNFNQLSKDYSRRIFKPEWLTYLVRDFNVSAEWLLTGEGKKFKKRES